MEGLCGRACDTCTWRDPLDCPGCQTGPGRPYSGDCGIADCCLKKGHADCSSCTYISCCHLRCQREDMPRRRLRELEERQQRQDWLDRNAPVLAKWLWLLFWLVIPRTLAETLTLDEVASSFPAAGTVGEVLGALASLAYGAFLWQLRTVGGRYRTAALCSLAGSAGSAVILFAVPEESGLWWALSLPAAVLELVSVYQECNAHADVLEGLDDRLAGKWRLLWRWKIGLLLGIFGSVLLMLLSVLLSLLVMLAIAVGAIVVAVLQLVYLYRTAKLFRQHCPAALPEHLE